MSPDDAYAGGRVLVTGGLGFIGSNLVIELVRLGAEVTVMDCLVPVHGGNGDGRKPQPLSLPAHFKPAV